MDRTITQFPKMGNAVGRSVVNASGAKSPNTKPVKRHALANGGMIAAALTEGVRRSTTERHGASYRPTAKIVAATDPVSGANGRNTYTVPSAVGNRDFYDRRWTGRTI